MTPPSHRQAGRFFFSHPLKHIHLHFKHVKEMASVSAAVTVFGRQARAACLCDTDKIYLAANTTLQHVLQGTVAQNGCHRKSELVGVILKWNKLNVQNHC